MLSTINVQFFNMTAVPSFFSKNIQQCILMVSTKNKNKK